MNRLLHILVFVIGLTSCNSTEADIISKLKKSEDIQIELNTYGGLAGYYEQKFHLKMGLSELLLISDEGSDYQTFYRIDEEKRELFNSFLDEAVATNDMNKEMSGGCIGGTDSEYVLRTGYSTLTLRPDDSCDSIFYLLMKD